MRELSWRSSSHSVGRADGVCTPMKDEPWRFGKAHILQASHQSSAFLTTISPPLHDGERTSEQFSPPWETSRLTWGLPEPKSERTFSNKQFAVSVFASPYVWMSERRIMQKETDSYTEEMMPRSLRPRILTISVVLFLSKGLRSVMFEAPGRERYMQSPFFGLAADDSASQQSTRIRGKRGSCNPPRFRISLRPQSGVGVQAANFAFCSNASVCNALRVYSRGNR